MSGLDAPIGRRAFLQHAGFGLGAAALADLRGIGPSGPQGPHHRPRIKRVIWLCMAGGPSHLETFDYKPKLDQLNGQPMPESFTKGQPIAQLQGQALFGLRRLQLEQTEAQLAHGDLGGQPQQPGPQGFAAPSGAQLRHPRPRCVHRQGRAHGHLLGYRHVCLRCCHLLLRCRLNHRWDASSGTLLCRIAARCFPGEAN